MITHTTLETLPAQLDDVPGIYELLKSYSDNGVLLPRSMDDIYNSLREFYVISKDNRVIACSALQIYTHELGEVRSLAVSQNHENNGLGKLLVKRIEEEARELGLQRLMALTYVDYFFHKLGYNTVEMNTLPEKVWGVCINCHKFMKCDEIAVLKILS